MRLLWSLILVLVGCGGPSSGKPLHQFPARSALSEIAATQQKGQPLPVDVVAPEEWALALPAAGAKNPGHALLATLTPAAKPSAALDCVAHELARLLLETQKRPSVGLRRFISARCGALTAQPAFQTWSFEVPETDGDQAVYARLREQAQALDGNVRLAGIGLARSGTKGAIVVAYGDPEVEVEPFERVVGADGTLKIRGRVLFETDALLPYINAGAYGVTRCALDPSVAAPEFAISCPLAAGDDHAWVELSAIPRGRVLGHQVLGVLALRSSSSASVYRALQLGEPRPVGDPAAFEGAVLEALNEIRGQLDMTPLVAAGKQSQVASSVTPAFFSAMLSERDGSTNVVDAISLGLLAGWDVSGGMIRNGELVASLTIDALDASRWLAEALEQPTGRAVLLDEDARVLALGSTLQPSPKLLAALAVTYAFFEQERTFGERATQVLERLARVRQARKLGQTVFVREAAGVKEQLARIQRGEATPSEALRSLMQQTASDMPGVSVQGFVWETQDLDALEFPRELLQEGDLAFAAGVTYYKAKGGAWGQYAVLFVVVNTGKTTKV